MAPKIHFDEARAAALNAAGMSLTEISRLPNMPCAATIRRHLVGAVGQVFRGHRKLHDVTRDELLELHHGQQMPAGAIGKIYGCSASAMRRKLAAFGLSKGCGKSRRPRGSQSHKWRGGRYVSRSGYVFVHRPSHPNVLANGYVPEHRLVVSESIGRPLRRDEEVHHIDGNKKNNRLSNLIVMPRGKHQRLHADVHRELWALRAEVERLRGLDPCRSLSPPQGGLHHCVDWKVVG